ncbi:MAG: DNA/RNA non-specific endonuclease, partial [Clostridia bacterium]|nr:DNA/RNA non-specific endonuclease [Clostridia bacterium]
MYLRISKITLIIIYQIGITTDDITSNTHSYNLENIPAYTGKSFVTINNNVPFFEENDFTEEAFEKYSKLDKQGRCGVAFANVCVDIMPKEGEKRESISNIKNLSGWVQKEYPNIIGTRYLYNRCHLIGWQLSAENANIQNLMTGTAYLNYAM